MEQKYTKKNITKEWLIENNFYHNRIYSDKREGIEAYSYRFPVYKSGISTLLECELLAEVGNDEIKVNVYDYGSHCIYASWYCREYGNYEPILKIIENNIRTKLKYLGIEAKNNG